MQMDENTPLAISVENVSKKFRLGTFGEHHRLTEAISDGFKALLSGNFKTLTGDTREFWALENISFQVLKGEVVGIIGHNGAGKSTLLKILSRIVTPTKGRIGVRGRIGSLLEVGTGFHPELTGRENIYLNGAILGMKRSEIRNRFDQIVEFAEVGQFLDTPVKRYSNGMIVRLGFPLQPTWNPMC